LDEVSGHHKASALTEHSISQTYQCSERDCYQRFQCSDCLKLSQTSRAMIHSTAGIGSKRGIIILFRKSVKTGLRIFLRKYVQLCTPSDTVTAYWRYCCYSKNTPGQLSLSFNFSSLNLQFHGW
jgi:hypothetical protein